MTLKPPRYCEVLFVRCTTRQKLTINQAADRAGVPASAWVRQVALAEAQRAQASRKEKR